MKAIRQAPRHFMTALAMFKSSATSASYGREYDIPPGKDPLEKVDTDVSTAQEVQFVDVEY
jgi:hypothetical protein